MDSVRLFGTVLDSLAREMAQNSVPEGPPSRRCRTCRQQRTGLEVIAYHSLMTTNGVTESLLLTRPDVSRRLSVDLCLQDLELTHNRPGQREAHRAAIALCTYIWKEEGPVWAFTSSSRRPRSQPLSDTAPCLRRRPPNKYLSPLRLPTFAVARRHVQCRARLPPSQHSAPPPRLRLCCSFVHYCMPCYVLFYCFVLGSGGMRRRAVALLFLSLRRSCVSCLTIRGPLSRATDSSHHGRRNASQACAPAPRNAAR